MRTLKFRAMNKENNKWIYYDLSLPGGMLPLTAFGNGEYASFDLLGNTIVVYNLCEWTGLKDKNSKDIYEGDIVTYTGESDVCVETYEGPVVFEDGMFKIDSDSLDCFDLEEYIVVGNLYENPNLLEKTNV